MKIFKLPKWNRIDYISIVIMAILLGVGIYCLRMEDILTNSTELLYKKQIFGIIIGGALMFVLLFVDWRFIINISPILYIGIILILAYTIIFGQPINNVKRWVKIGGIQLQPSELAKLVLILFIAYLCNIFKDQMDKMTTLLILGVAVAIPLVLILLEPHLSTSLVIVFIFCVMVYLAGISYRLIGIVTGIAVPILLFIIIGVGIFNIKIPFIKSYQVNRIMSYFSDDEEENSSGKYQQNQALTAIAGGGSTGKAIEGQSETRAYASIYANESDFVFSAVGEEFGFIGSTIVILLFFILVLRCMSIGIHSPDNTAKLICMGISSMFMFQVFVNIGVATSILPNTGLPLPFISYGLTSLVNAMASMGIVLNIGMNSR